MATLRKQLIEVALPLDAINLSPPVALSNDELLAGGSLRGPVWHKPASGEHYATAAGIVLLPRDPSAAFPQCRILADAYRGAEPDGDSRDHEDIRGPMPLAIERGILVRQGLGRAAVYVLKEGIG